MPGVCNKAVPAGPFGPALAVALLAGAAAGQAGAIALPSGRAVSFHDVIQNEPGPTGLTVRFRFVEADLAEVLDVTPYEELEADMRYLCESYALGRISNTGPRPTGVVISISDRPVEFGAPDPDVAQVFEVYRPDGAACVWEGY